MPDNGLSFAVGVIALPGLLESVSARVQVLLGERRSDYERSRDCLARRLRREKQSWSARSPPTPRLIRRPDRQAERAELVEHDFGAGRAIGFVFRKTGQDQALE